MGVDGAVQAVAQQRAEIVRETVGVDAFALDQAGVAERGLFARPAAVEQHHRLAALLQVQRHADADDACTEHDHIALLHCTGSRKARPGRGAEREV